MRERDLERFPAEHPDLAERVKGWREEHPAGTLAGAVTDLGLWPGNPLDRDAMWFVWRELYDQDDPVAVTAGFPGMRAAALAAKRRPA